MLSQRILVRTFFQHQLSFRLCCLGETWFRPSIKLSCQSYVIGTLSLCTPYVWENTWFCLFLSVLSPRTVDRTFLQHHTSFAFVFLGKNEVQIANVRLGNTCARFVNVLTVRKQNWLDIKERRHAAIHYHRKRNVKNGCHRSRTWKHHHQHWQTNTVPTFKALLYNIGVVF